MTAEEYKKLKPEHKDLEGDLLWDAMTAYMLNQQMASEIIKPIMPLWKTHTLRYLFYRKKPNFIMGNPKTDKYVSDKRCKSCKQGVNYKVGFMSIEGCTFYCPHCGRICIEEPNTNFTHKAYKFYKSTINLFWIILEKLHIVRSSVDGRYGMFGDEARYVKGWSVDLKTGKSTPMLRERKWWQYILIEKRIHNF